jgi:hypothetical protein
MASTPEDCPLDPKGRPFSGVCGTAEQLAEKVREMHEIIENENSRG